MELWEHFGAPWMFYAQVAFTVGMLVHAYRTAATFWYFIIFLLPPIGAWAYFFIVFLRSFQLGRGVSTVPLWQRKLSLAELRYRAERTPTVNNRLALAQHLMEKGQHAEAIPLLEAILAADQIHCEAMHDLALCRLACNQPAEAVAMLDRLLKRDSRWAYYRAWPTLIDAHVAAGKPLAALEACRQLERMVPTLENRCLLAEHLLDNKLSSEAIHVLDRALEEHSFLPMGKRLKTWRWARRAPATLERSGNSLTMTLSPANGVQK